MTPGKPFLSVVMPVHEGAEWIAATLNSVVAGPTSDTEFIVIDSSPTNASAAIINHYRSRLQLRLIERTDVTPWQSKTNIGVELSSGEHVCILHQDDLWLPGRVDTVRRWLTAAPEAALHLAPTLMIDREGREVGQWRCPLPAEQVLQEQFFLERLLIQNFVSVPAPVFRRSAWLQRGGMDDRLWYTADWDMWAKLSNVGLVVYHDEVTTAFRVHGSSLTVTGSRDRVAFRAQMETVLERYLDRIPSSRRAAVERAARVSIEVNVSLATAAGGSIAALGSTAVNLMSLGPLGIRNYLRNSRLHERVASRVRAKMAGAF